MPKKAKVPLFGQYRSRDCLNCTALYSLLKSHNAMPCNR
jgi:hypothetical protein